MGLGVAVGICVGGRSVGVDVEVETLVLVGSGVFVRVDVEGGAQATKKRI